MKNHKYIPLKRAVEFHGHLGPWLVLGLITGKYIIETLKAQRHFGLKIKAYGLNKKPQTCLLDGLQLSTGCTLGKFNLLTMKAKSIKIDCLNTKTGKRTVVSFKKDILDLLGSLNDHKASERIAREFYRLNPSAFIK